MKPRLLDLFCGAGGAAVGYARAGFEVVGVDHRPQPRYPFEFVQGDALWLLEVLVQKGSLCPSETSRYWLRDFAAIHASPLWFKFAPLQYAARARHDDEVTPVVELLRASGLPYVCESGTLGPLTETVKLCGASVGLEVVRHMWFETNFPCLVPPCAHTRGGTTTGQYVAFRDSRRCDNGRRVPPRRKTQEWKEAAGLGWMTHDQARLAVPPAYTELIGHQLMQHLRARSAA